MATNTEPVIKLADLGKAPPFALSEAEVHEIHEEMHHYPDTRAASIGAIASTIPITPAFEVA